MSRFWNKNTAKIVPYTPGEQPKSVEKIVKLNTNENPYGPTPLVAEFLRNYSTDELRLYPSCAADRATEAFAESVGFPKSMVFAGNGSDEVLGMCFKAFYDEEKQVNFPDISYSFYSVYCELFGIKYNLIPLLSDFSEDVEGLCSAKGGIVIANPNAPTSVFTSLNDLEKILKAHRDDVVIVDEAYVEFGGETALPLIDKYDNLLVVRTMSKSYSLAGMRMGFAVGNPELIEGLNRVKNSFNSYTVDRLADRIAEIAIKDRDYHEKTLKMIIDTRARTTESFRKLGFKVLDSKANFIFVTKDNFDAKGYYEFLKKENVLIRYFNKPRINNYVRITVGTDDEMDILLKKTEVFLNEKC